MRNLTYTIFNGHQKVATVNTLAEAKRWEQRGRKAVPTLVKAGPSREEREALEKFYQKVRERNPQNPDRREIRFKAV